MALFRKRKRKELKKGRARRVSADSDDGSNDDAAGGVRSGSAGPSVTAGAAASSAQSVSDDNPHKKVPKIDTISTETVDVDAHAAADATAAKKDKKGKKSKKGKKKGKKKRDGSSTVGPRLSIGFEFENEGAAEAGTDQPFSIKKSKASRHLARQLKRGKVTGFGLNPDANSISVSVDDASPTDTASHTSAYSADALRELREQQKSMNEKSLRVLEELRQDEDVGAPASRIIVGEKPGTDEHTAQGEEDDDPLFDREEDDDPPAAV
eukprot:INCI13052.1.p1 GENE.INCI13052.1~~INCI13052.1.p1  ORF type:complete len:266 (-),score=78.62 INCI13052.1:32-829(-)